MREGISELRRLGESDEARLLEFLLEKEIKELKSK
jgi:hypothetical protein